MSHIKQKFGKKQTWIIMQVNKSIEQLEERLGRRLNPKILPILPLTFKNIRNKPTVLDRTGKSIRNVY